MLDRIFLKKREALASQVAENLLRSGARDLCRVEVWIPTAGAGRRIRSALAESGVLSPRFTQSMRALLPNECRMAQRFEREGAWALALGKLDHQFLEPLFSDAKLDSEGSRLKSGGVLCDLCDLLAEAGWSPSHPRMREVCGEDSARWDVLGRIYPCYLAALEDFGLTDPNEARFAEMANPSRVGEVDRLVIACIPDLPLAAQRYAEALASRGVEVEVLVWLPEGLGGGFDPWGRPDPSEWEECRLEVELSQISAARSPEDEARLAINFAVSCPVPGDYAVVLADPKLGISFRSEIESRGGAAFLPDGIRLGLSEPGVLALEWARFRSLGELRVLRRLIELPHFSRVLRGDSELKNDDCLAVCDFLIGEAVFSEMPQAEAFVGVEFDPKKDKSKRRAQAVIFIQLVKSLLSLTVPELLAKAWRSGGESLEAARSVAELYETIEASPLYRDEGEGVDQAFPRALKSEMVFNSSNPGEVELSGWLEAPWIESRRLALGGCAEGFLPSSVNGHPFLPDSKRSSLGLVDNAARFARDAYLFQCLLLTRPPEEFHISFSRFDGEGSPAMPSRLLLRCGEDALPERVIELFSELPRGARRPRRSNDWRWTLPAAMRRTVVKMSPTDFGQYLACPFRFYLSRVLWLDAFHSDAREMDAKLFGTLVHEALEKYGTETPLEADAAKIERLVLGYLESSVKRLFGSSPSPAVRVQIAAAQIRLRSFARVQAEQFAAGWRIVSAERKLEADAENPFQVGPLNLSGKIDRIEKNELTGEWRVLDYKTHPKATPPAKKHFSPRLFSEWLPSAELEFHNGKRQVKKRWADLQLPLYSQILRHWHGTEIGDAPVLTAYFTLSADPSETSVKNFTELHEEVLASSLECAKEIADLVHRGVFWPPQPFKTSWDDPFEALFLNGNPENCVAMETVEFLKGRK
jgi:ATP-dependent helicase/nuclease subunit B